MNISAVFEIADATVLQIAVRPSLGKRTLERVRVDEIALKDIILPGDIREILNQVMTAEKQAQANLIRRREETAATHPLLLG